MAHKSRISVFCALIGVFLIYSCTSVFTKLASMQEFLSVRYLLFLAGAVVVMGIYALIWQQILKRMPVSDAYMWKGSTVIFTLALSALLFGECITWMNVLGTLLIVSGIALFAKSDV